MSLISAIEVVCGVLARLMRTLLLLAVQAAAGTFVIFIVYDPLNLNYPHRRIVAAPLYISIESTTLTKDSRPRHRKHHRRSEQRNRPNVPGMGVVWLR